MCNTTTINSNKNVRASAFYPFVRMNKKSNVIFHASPAKVKLTKENNCSISFPPSGRQKNPIGSHNLGRFKGLYSQLGMTQQHSRSFLNYFLLNIYLAFRKGGQKLRFETGQNSCFETGQKAQCISLCLFILQFWPQISPCTLLDWPPSGVRTC